MKLLEFPALNRLGQALAITALLYLVQNAWGVTDPTLQVSLIRSGQSTIVSWTGLNAVPYQLEASSDLTDWANAGPVITGNGSLLSFTNSGVGQSHEFFRVQRVFPAAPGSAVFDPVTGVLTIVGDALHTVINVANDGTGVIIINNGTMPITGGVATIASTVLIQILGSPGDDQISVANGLPPAHIFGAEGSDTLSGGNASDLIVGGPGNDTLSGRQGSDLLYPDGGDTVVWNPGDGSDTIEGQGGSNTLVFNGANVSETITLSANGSRFQLTRDVAAITLDVNGVQTVNINALGGADNVVVNNLVGTSVTRVNVDLASVLGTTNGDAQVDTVTINGTPGPDTFNVAANGSALDVTGPGALVHVTNAEPANDRIVVNGVGGDLVNVNGTAGADVMQLLPSGVAGHVLVFPSISSAPVDVSGALTLSVNGLGGPDTISAANGIAATGIPITLDGGDGDDIITGSDASETIFGGPGNDTVSGGRGNDLIFLGDGNDTVIWNPGDGNDTIEGQIGNDTLFFNGANITENIALSANGSRLRLTRDVANITMDVDGVETISVQALGGADNLTVNSLAGTAVTKVNLDLAATGGAGDAQIDTVTINGSAGPDTFNIAANGSTVEVTGLGTLVHVTGAELANDRIAINGVGGDTVNVNGTAGADTMQVLPSTVVGYLRASVSGFTAPVDVIGALTLSVNGLGGPDTIASANGVATLGIPIILDGGDGDDIITGGDASETIFGGPGNDTVSGGRGNDVIFLDDGNDTAIWNPGDGNDTIEGQGGNNTLVFNGSNANENIALSANGSRLLLTRDVAAIVMDVNGVQTVNVQALGGADAVTVNSLAGTSVAQVNIDLAATGGAGDALADTVLIGGTAGSDTFNIAANGNAVEVTGLGALVHITGAELANDRIAVNGVGGDTVNVNGTDAADTMQILPSSVVGYARVVVSGFTAPVDVIGALTLSVNGLGGPDTIAGANGVATLGIPIILDGGDGDDIITGSDASETIFGGAGNDTVSGGRGSDVVLLGDGNDTAIWNPGDGSDTIEGQIGNDTLVFNGANITENIVLSANGSRLRLTRDVANITMDLDGVETVNVQALGGADNLTVNSLAGTAVTQVNLDLAATGGAGDGAADTVTIYGTASPDTINLTAGGNSVIATGLAAQVQIAHPEVANDTLIVNGLGGTDIFTIGPGVTTLIGVILNQ